MAERTKRGQNDPAWRRERGRKGAAESNSLDSRIRSIVRRAGELTPEQIAQLRALLPPVR